MNLNNSSNPFTPQLSGPVWRTIMRHVEEVQVERVKAMNALKQSYLLLYHGFWKSVWMKECWHHVFHCIAVSQQDECNKIVLAVEKNISFSLTWFMCWAFWTCHKKLNTSAVLMHCQEQGKISFLINVTFSSENHMLEMEKHAVADNYIYMITVYKVNETLSEISHLTLPLLLAFTVCLYYLQYLCQAFLNTESLSFPPTIYLWIWSWPN